MRRYLKPLLWLACIVPVVATAAEPAKVFPVQGFFYDAATDSKLDPLFRESLSQQAVVNLGRHIHDALTPAFGSRVGKLDQRTAGNTFAVSFHVTRANSFAVDKGNGNLDVVATLTGGIYFTNVVSGEILTTLSRTVISRAVVANQVDLNAERRGLFKQALDTLIQDLTTEAPRQFHPVVIETHLTDRVGDLLIFDAGYRQGIAAGDRIEDSADNLVEIVYAGENYAVGKPVLASNLSLGAQFQKFSAHAASGKDRPRVAVLVDKQPEGYAKDYIARLFAELLGDAAPLSLVQINTGFTQLLQTVREQDGVELSAMKSAERNPPGFIVRLRVPDTVYYEAGTNLDYEKQRRYETRAFADVIDNSGRIIYSAMGTDVISDKIVRGVGAGPEERREVSIKNALTDLSRKLGQIGELKRDRAEIVASSGQIHQINSQGRVYGAHQPGVILRKAKARVGKETREILLPTLEASIAGHAGQPLTTLNQGLPIDTRHDKVAVGDLFEVLRLGTPARTAASLAACGPIETLGNTRTPALMELTGLILGQKMPGMLYAPDAKHLSDGVIAPRSGFASGFPWNLPPVSYCIQPVERVNIGEEQCSAQCERTVVSRYTLRVKKGDDILNRITFEGQFKSAGYYAKSTAPDQLKRLLDADVLDEARGLLEKAVDKIDFPPP
jgi:hypothetical protein